VNVEFNSVFIYLCVCDEKSKTADKGNKTGFGNGAINNNLLTSVGEEFLIQFKQFHVIEKSNIQLC